jgi:D-alanine-D-alanine ligase
MVKKKNVVVFYGGRSTEHEVSCRSAAYIFRYLDRDKYRVYGVGVDKDGVWWPSDMTDFNVDDYKREPIRKHAYQPSLPSLSPAALLAAISPREGAFEPADWLVFPVIHGAGGEDGTLQGFLDLCQIAYVGPDAAGSAIGMDKVLSKKLAALHGVPVVPWVDFRADDWQRDQAAILRRAEVELGYPMFVKPARLGSSVGVTRATSLVDLEKACRLALTFDDRVLLEKGLKVREIEVAMLGGYTPRPSTAGEVIAHTEFYSYESKYSNATGASVKVPADLTPQQLSDAQALAVTVFKALDLYGMARVDLFLDTETGKYYLNEVNTIPGFTEISQYPMLWQASGLSPSQLLDELLSWAYKRWEVRSRFVRTNQ